MAGTIACACDRFKTGSVKNGAALQEFSDGAQTLVTALRKRVDELGTTSFQILPKVVAANLIMEGGGLVTQVAGPPHAPSSAGLTPQFSVAALETSFSSTPSKGRWVR